MSLLVLSTEHGSIVWVIYYSVDACFSTPKRLNAKSSSSQGKWLPQSHIDGVLLAPPPSLAPSQSDLSRTLGLAHPWGSAWSCSLSWPLGIWPHSPGSSLGSLSSPCLSAP